jgi:hypothetical protein
LPDDVAYCSQIFVIAREGKCDGVVDKSTGKGGDAACSQKTRFNRSSSYNRFGVLDLAWVDVGHNDIEWGVELSYALHHRVPVLVAVLELGNIARGLNDAGVIGTRIFESGLNHATANAAIEEEESTARVRAGLEAGRWRAYHTAAQVLVARSRCGGLAQQDEREPRDKQPQST